VKVDDIFATRAYVNALEQAVAASLQNSNGRVGKFNVIVDGHNFSWGLLPSLHQLQTFVTMLQDHFPDRLGIVLLTNLGRVGEFLVGILKPIISEEGEGTTNYIIRHVIIFVSNFGS
jgi:CRAL/TRIO domain